MIGMVTSGVLRIYGTLHLAGNRSYGPHHMGDLQDLELQRGPTRVGHLLSVRDQEPPGPLTQPVLYLIGAHAQKDFHLRLLRSTMSSYTIHPTTQRPIQTNGLSYHSAMSSLHLMLHHALSSHDGDHVLARPSDPRDPLRASAHPIAKPIAHSERLDVDRQRVS
jgi:hypothetical protein